MGEDPVREIIAEVLGIDADALDEDSGVGITPNWDSLRNVMIMAGLESRLGVKFPFASYEGVATLRGIRALLSRHGVPSRPGA